MARIKVTINTKIRQCDHCGVHNIKRTFCITNPEIVPIYIGRICISNITNIDTSGNPHRAAERIEEYLNTLDIEDVYDMFTEAP